jgi:hypothetical protein
MTTEKQVEANRRNASKSTGPKTDGGKSSSRLNALRHGLRARTVVQPGDDQSEFDQLSADIQQACNPQNQPEQLLVEKMVIAEWQLARLQRSESILLLEQQGTIDAAHMPLFDRLSQFQARLERTSIRVYKELLQLAKARPPESENRPKELIVRWVTLFPKRRTTVLSRNPS